MHTTYYVLPVLVGLHFIPISAALVFALSSSRSTSRKRMAALKSQRIHSVEEVAVKRFTKGYDKLCKTCPTLLRPRVETLVEMIMGLPAEERDDLLATVSRRINEATKAPKEIAVGSRSPREVYNFQLTGNIATSATPPLSENGVADMDLKDKDAMQRTQIDLHPETDETKDDIDQELRKAISKMKKARGKLRQTKIEVVRVDRLLSVTALLLSRNRKQQVRDEEDDEEFDELRSMTREELKIQHLKYMERKAKCQRSRAKNQRKRYIASLKIARLNAKEMYN